MKIVNDVSYIKIIGLGMKYLSFVLLCATASMAYAMEEEVSILSKKQEKQREQVKSKKHKRRLTPRRSLLKVVDDEIKECIQELASEDGTIIAYKDEDDQANDHKHVLYVRILSLFDEKERLEKRFGSNQGNQQRKTPF